MRGPLSSAGRRSARLYLRLAPADIALFKFILEGYDNLAYLTVIDKFEAVVRLVFSPDQRDEVMEFLAAAGGELKVEIIDLPLGESRADSGAQRGRNA